MLLCDAHSRYPLQFSSLADVNYSTRVLYQQMTEPREVSKIHDYGNDFVDVRDVANVTLATLQSDRVGGQRFILDAGAYTFQNLCKSHASSS